MRVIQTDLLDRYLHAVKFWLPKAQQQDILAELAEDLHSQIEEREAALGHPLDEAGLVDILKRRGSPMRVASGYLTQQRLIDPAMLPVYRLVLKIGLLCVLAPLFLIAFVVPVFTNPHPGGAMLRFWEEAWRSGLTVVGLVTTVFVLLDRYRSKFQFDKWNPRKLPRAPASSETSRRFGYLTGFLFAAAAVAFWVAWIGPRTEFAFAGGFRVILNPIWREVYWLVLVLTIADACVDLFSFLYPSRQQLRAGVRVVLDAAAIVMAALAFKVGNWVELVDPAISARSLTLIMKWLDGSIQVTLISIVVIKVIDAVIHLRRKPAPRLTLPAHLQA